MFKARAATFISMIFLFTTACASSAPSPGVRSADPSASSGGSPATTQSKTLVMVGRSEMPSLASKPLQSFGLASGTGVRLFNAGLTLKDDKGNGLPYLAEALPKLNSNDWRVSPDGSMETTYRLRPNLTWHDGTPLTAEDFAFSLAVYSVPELGHSASPPINLMDQVLTPDARTIVIRWKAPYAYAGLLETSGIGNTPSFPPLPRQQLEEAFRQGNWESFATLPAWNTEYIGLGPYKLDRWEAGSFMEGVGFAGHALGRPKIDRFRMLFIPDFNTVLANMLSGEGHISVDDPLGFQQAMILRREWSPRNLGQVMLYPQYWRWTQIQQRAEYASPRSLTDVRVRRALIHSVDKQSLNDALFEGEGIMSETAVPPTAPEYALVDRTAVKFPFDPRMSARLMGEAGYTRGSDGVFVTDGGERFSTEVTVIASPQNESEMAIMASAWRQNGFDIKEVVWPAIVSRDAQRRATHMGLTNTGGPSGEATVALHAAADTPRPENRWNGVNRGGWFNPEFDQVTATFNATLDRDERARLLAEMVRIFTDDAGVISLYFNLKVTAVTASLIGPAPAVPESDVSWNVHEWTFKS